MAAYRGVREHQAATALPGHSCNWSHYATGAVATKQEDDRGRDPARSGQMLPRPPGRDSSTCCPDSPAMTQRCSDRASATADILETDVERKEHPLGL